MFYIGKNMYHINKKNHVIDKYGKTAVIYTKGIKTNDTILTYDCEFVKLYLLWQYNVINHDLKCNKPCYMMYHSYVLCDEYNFDESLFCKHYNGKLEDLLLVWVEDVDINHHSYVKMSHYCSTERFDELYSLAKLYH